MKTTLLILAVLFGVMPMLFARFKRAMAENGSIRGGAAESEENSDAADGDIFNFENEAEDAVEQQPYFTYEAPEAETAPVQPVRAMLTEEQPQQQRFDLRQAVIYQTLLNNRYINLEN